MTAPTVSSLTASALVTLDYAIDREERGGMDNAVRLALIERGQTLAAEFLACLAAQPEVAHLRVEDAERVSFTFRQIRYTWRINVYRAGRDVFQDAWSIGFNMPTRRSSLAREPNPMQRAFYSRDGRDARAETAVKGLVSMLDASYAADVVEVEATSARTVREQLAQKMTAETGHKVEAGYEAGFEATIKVTDADKLARLLAFAATL